MDNTSRSNRIEDCVYWYRAKPNRKFRIGDKELWKLHARRYDKDSKTQDKKERATCDSKKTKSKEHPVSVKAPSKRRTRKNSPLYKI